MTRSPEVAVQTAAATTTLVGLLGLLFVVVLLFTCCLLFNGCLVLLNGNTHLLYGLVFVACCLLHVYCCLFFVLYLLLVVVCCLLGSNSKEGLAVNSTFCVSLSTSSFNSEIASGQHLWLSFDTFEAPLTHPARIRNQSNKPTRNRTAYGFTEQDHTWTQACT